MRIFIIYAHPSDRSFTYEALNNFIKGLESSGHSYVISDLYKMNFASDISEAEYLREADYRKDISPPGDVLAEQEKINSSDVIVFISPLFWGDMTTKMAGWFSRVFTYGFAYGDDRTMKQLEKGLVIFSAGNTLEYLKEKGIYNALEKVIIEDRLYDRVKKKELLILDGTSRDTPLSPEKRKAHLEKAFMAGKLIGE